MPWMLVSFPGVLQFTWLLLSPPDSIGPVYLFCVVSGYLLFVTAFDVPYSSIGLEISPNVHAPNIVVSAPLLSTCST